jgi:hypothetical protein
MTGASAHKLDADEVRIDLLNDGQRIPPDPSQMVQVGHDGCRLHDERKEHPSLRKDQRQRHKVDDEREVHPRKRLDLNLHGAPIKIYASLEGKAL